MVLYIIGLGLGDEKDITVKGLEAVKRCSKVFLEAYTAVLGVDQKKLEAYYGKTITIADRTMVEQGSDEIIVGADQADHAMLVVGDPLAATTHTDLLMRCKERGVPTQVIHNASIMNAVASCGLSLYRFGQTISIPYVDEGQALQTSWYDKLGVNVNAGLHTLCLLDIKVKEQTPENIQNNVLVFEPPRFMTIAESVEHLLAVEKVTKKGLVTPETFFIGLARVGREDQVITSGRMKDVSKVDFGGPLHSLVIPGEMELYEHDMFNEIHWDRENALKEAEVAREEAKARKMEEIEKRRQERRRVKAAAESKSNASKPISKKKATTVSRKDLGLDSESSSSEEEAVVEQGVEESESEDETGGDTKVTDALDFLL